MCVYFYVHLAISQQTIFWYFYFCNLFSKLHLTRNILQWLYTHALHLHAQYQCMLNGQRHFKHLWSTGIPLIKSQAKDKIKEKEEITHFNWETQYPLGPPPQFLWLPAASTVNKPITTFSGQSPQFVCFSLYLRRLKSPPNEFIINIL